jgi:hypothetical protein
LAIEQRNHAVLSDAVWLQQPSLCDS